MQVGDKVKYLGITDLYDDATEFEEDIEAIEEDGLIIGDIYEIRYTTDSGRGTQWLQFENLHRYHDSAFFQIIKDHPSIWDLT